VNIKRSLVRIFVIAEKEWIQIRRDARSLILALVMPAFLVVLFGYALNMDVKNVKVGIYDQDRTAFSRDYLERFSHTGYIRIVRYLGSYREIDRAIDHDDIVMAIVLPVNFSKRYSSGKPAEVQVLVDGADSTSATIAVGYIKAITYQFNRELQKQELARQGITGVRLPIAVKSRVWYNAELQSKNFIVPGVIVMIIAIISALITSLTMSREWERGTMETLITTPVRGFEVITGKLVPYFLIGIFDVITTLCAGYFIFGVPMRGSYIELCLIASLFLVGTSGLGILISSATRVQVLSVQVAIIITYLPSFILSGFIFPIKNMPVIIQGITYIIPARYMITVMKDLALKGVGHSLLMTQILFLSIFTVLVILLSIKKFRVQLPE